MMHSFISQEFLDLEIIGALKRQKFNLQGDQQ